MNVFFITTVTLFAVLGLYFTYKLLSGLKKRDQEQVKQNKRYVLNAITGLVIVYFMNFWLETVMNEALLMLTNIFGFAVILLVGYHVVDYLIQVKRLEE